MPKESVKLHGANRPTIGGRPIFACLKRTGESRLLDAPGETRALWVGVDEHTLAIHAPRVAFAFTAYYIDTHETYVRIRDLRSGSETHSCPAGGYPDWVAFPHIAKIVLNGKGSVAWSVQKYPPAAEKAIVACDSAGERILDSGEGVDLESLSIQRSMLSWLNDGSRREAWLE